MAIDDVAYGGFEDEIGEEADQGGFTLLPPGAYPFTILVPVEREYYNGSDKIPACWKANLTLAVDAGELGTVNVYTNFFLTKKQSWKIKRFFVCLGLIDAKAEKFTPPWNSIVGASGVVKIGNRTYNGKEYNEVVEFIAPDKAAEAVAKTVLGDAQTTPTPAPVPQTSFNFPRAGA